MSDEPSGIGRRMALGATWTVTFRVSVRLIGLVSTAAFYAAYAWIAVAAIARRITLGDMTMYLLVFKQGQGALASMLAAIRRFASASSTASLPLSITQMLA